MATMTTCPAGKIFYSPDQQAEVMFILKKGSGPALPNVRGIDGCRRAAALVQSLQTLVTDFDRVAAGFGRADYGGAAQNLVIRVSDNTRMVLACADALGDTRTATSATTKATASVVSHGLYRARLLFI